MSESQQFGFTPSLAGPQAQVEDGYRSDEDENFDDIKKRLFLGSNSETPAPKSKQETVQVYLRVRPRSSLEIQMKQPECFHFDNGGQELLAIPPRSSQVYKNKSTNLSRSKFTFTSIFGPDSTQADLFEEALLPSMRDFLDGQNCLVFTYGVTNSGKTYTVSGTPTNPGLLPRLLDVVFNSVQDGQLLTDVKFRPKHYSEVSYSSEKEMTSQRELKERLLTKAVEPDHNPTLPMLDETDAVSEQDISCVSSTSKVSSNISKLSSDDGMSFELPVHDCSSIVLDDSGHYYSVWVSYAEIYNEFIYDLLGDPPVKGKPRQVLRLQDDKNHNQFIRGLREVQVNTIEEAMLLLKYGLRHRSQAATRLNYNSSRSHSIYTVKIVKVANPNKPSNALVNRISVVDLAGAERSSKTGASGARVKEAGQINKSLLTLGKCIDAMKHNQQKKGEDHIVPFRESKLTRLFQNYFVGKGGKEARQGKVTMFVNISNTASVFDETLHVLKFSALTSKVMPLVKVLPGPTPRKLRGTGLPPPTPSMLTHTHTRPSRYSSEEEQETSNSTERGECSHCKSLEELVSSLHCELRGQEFQIRQEVCREFNEQLIEIEDNHSRELELQAEEIEEMYEKRMKNLQRTLKREYTRKRRRREDEEDDGSEVRPEEKLRALVDELESRNRELEEELTLERERAAAEAGDVAESHETRVVTLNQQLAGKSVELTEKQKEVNRLKSELTTAQQELTTAQEELHGLRGGEDSQSALLSEVHTLKEKLSTSETSADYALAEVEILTSRISELTREKEEVEDKLRESSAQVSIAGCEECTSLQSQLSSLSEQYSQEKEQVTSLQSQLSSLSEQYSQEREQVTSLQSQLSSLSEQYGQEREQVTSLQSQLSLLSEQYGQEREQVTSLQSQLSSLSEQYGQEKEQVTSLQSQLSSLSEQYGQEREQVTSLQSQLSSLSEQYSQEREQWMAEKMTHLREEELWRTERATLTQSQAKETTLDKERADWASKFESLKTTHTTDMATWEEKTEALRETHSREKASLQSTIGQLQEAMEKESANSTSQLETLKSQVRELEEVRGALSSENEGLRTQLASLTETHHREKTAWENESEVLRNEVSSVVAKVTVKNEQKYKMESEKEVLEKEVAELKNALESRVSEILELTNQKDSLSMDIKRTLKEYETTLKNQTARIQALERENEVAVAQSEELTQQCSDLELRMSRACAAKGALSSRVEELTNSLEDSRRALSQRESELLDTSDQCKAVLEEQIASLKKSCATLEHQLTTAKEDGKALQTLLSDKENELLLLAKSVGGDRAELESVSNQLQEIVKSHQEEKVEHDKLLSEVNGNHQLEVAQYTIRVRELGEELEAKRAELENMSQSYESEVEDMRAKWDKEVQGLQKKLEQADQKLHKLAVAEADLKALRKSFQQQKKESEKMKKEVTSLQDSVNSLKEIVKTKEQEMVRLKVLHETALQSVKDDWRKEVGELKEARQQPTYEELPEVPSSEEVVYDTVSDSTLTSTSETTVLKPVENGTNSRRSYLAAVTSSTVNKSVLDTSKPLVPLLETSSQLEDDSLLADPNRKEIDATPLPLRRKKRTFLSRKKSVEKENPNLPTKKMKYTLRSRSKKIKEEPGDSGSLNSLECFTPTSQKGFMKHFTSKKKTPAQVAGGIASRTRTRKRLTSTLASGPTEYFHTPANQSTRQSSSGINLGKKLKPVKMTLD